MRFYAAALECSEKDPDTGNAFYSELKKCHKKGQIWIQYCYSR